MQCLLQTVCNVSGQAVILFRILFQNSHHLKMLNSPSDSQAIHFHLFRQRRFCGNDRFLL